MGFRMLANPDYMRQRSKMSDDPFSDILKLANARSVVSGGFTAGGRWAIRFPAPDKIKFFAIVKGRCWLCIDGEGTPVRVEAGDVFLLSAQRSFVLAGDLAAVPLDAASLFTGAVSRIAKLGDGGDCVQIGGHVRLDAASGSLLADVLPPLIHVRAASPQATVLRWLLDQLVRDRLEIEGEGRPRHCGRFGELRELPRTAGIAVHQPEGGSEPLIADRPKPSRRQGPGGRQMRTQDLDEHELGELRRRDAGAR
jgi:uncharacterized cupin superfamily protein